MRILSPHVETQLTLDEIEGLHRNALQILSEIGIKTENRELLSRMGGKKGVNIEDDRIFLSPDLVNQCVAEYRAQRSLTPQGLEQPSRITLKPYDYASYIVDIETDEIRPITQSDLVKMTRLVDSLQDIGYPVEGGCPGFAQDLPEELRAINQYRLSLEYSRTGREADLMTIPGAEAIYRMTEVMGELPFHLTLFILSPLRLDDASLERILYFLEKSYDIRIGVSAMPLLGATTPLSLRGALAQATAEMLAGFTLMKLLAGEKAMGFSIKLFSFDMRYSNISLGSAEELLLAGVCKEISAYYGCRGGVNAYIFSMSKMPGQQAAAEKAAQALYKGLAGVRTLTCGGATASTVFSPEQLIFDCEIVSYINRVISGFRIEDVLLDMDMIQECVRENSYLGHKSTVHGYRSIYWSPKIFQHSPYQSWREQELDQRQKVKQMVRELIAGHHYQLDADRFQEIEKIFHEAEVSISH